MAVHAEIAWDVAHSTYNGTNFCLVTQGMMGDVTETSTNIIPNFGSAGPVGGGTTAYGGGGTNGSTFNMGFQASPSDPDSIDIRGTVLATGRVTLVFTKDPGDTVNYIAMNVDPLSGVRYVETPTNIAVSFNILHPVASASFTNGELGSCFGMGINTATNTAFNYRGSVFVANLGPNDVQDPVNPSSGSIIINASGSNGVTATFVMYASTNWMNSVGMTDLSLAVGYFADTNGFSTTLPTGFGMTTNGYYSLSEGTNSSTGDAYIFVLTNSVWSSHDLGVMNSIAQYPYACYDNTIAITGYTGPGGVVTIPSEISGTNVTRIEAGAFSNCTRVTSIVISGNITNIGADAFASCSNLTAVYFTGNAPGAGSTAFSGANQVTVYYMPGHTGWTGSFAGLTPVLWNPQATNNVNFGMRASLFGFDITGPANAPIVVEGCTNLTSPVWTAVTNITLSSTPSYFCDPQSSNKPAVFYRFRAP